MSSQTAARWFVSDDEYDVATDEYVFCVQGGGITKNWLRSLEDRDGPLPDDIDTLYSYTKLWDRGFLTKMVTGAWSMSMQKEETLKNERISFWHGQRYPMLDKLLEEL